MDSNMLKEDFTIQLTIDLVERLKAMALSQNKSVDGLVEGILLDAVYYEPNEETLAAMAEAKKGSLQGPLDLTSIESMYKSMDL